MSKCSVLVRDSLQYVALVSQKHISICQNAVFGRVILCNMSRDLDKISGNIKREEKRKIFAI